LPAFDVMKYSSFAGSLFPQQCVLRCTLCHPWWHLETGRIGVSLSVC